MNHVCTLSLNEIHLTPLEKVAVFLFSAWFFFLRLNIKKQLLQVVHHVVQVYKAPWILYSIRNTKKKLLRKQIAGTHANIFLVLLINFDAQKNNLFSSRINIRIYTYTQLQYKQKWSYILHIHIQVHSHLREINNNVIRVYISANDVYRHTLYIHTSIHRHMDTHIRSVINSERIRFKKEIIFAQNSSPSSYPGCDEEGSMTDRVSKCP